MSLRSFSSVLSRIDVTVGGRQRPLAPSGRGGRTWTALGAGEARPTALRAGAGAG